MATLQPTGAIRNGVSTRRRPTANIDHLLSPDFRGSLCGAVPPLNGEQVRALLAKYDEASSIKDRFRIIEVLAFGGSALATGLITNALTHDYAGVDVGLSGAGRLLGTVGLLGLVANHDDAALTFLLKAAEPQFLESTRMFSREGDPVPRQRLREHCIVALGLIDRVEAKNTIERFREDPEYAWELGVASEVVEAAYGRDMVQQQGVEGGFRALGLEAFGEWKRQSTNGQQWCEWYEQIRKRHALQDSTLP